ncbi:MAG: hypothetical protein WB677_07475 [Xanthobacteraceae bacterium]
MEKIAVWKPIAMAPAEVDLELSVYDEGEYHALVFPCRRDGSGWRDVGANRNMSLRPTHWRLWDRRQVS